MAILKCNLTIVSDNGSARVRFPKKVSEEKKILEASRIDVYEVDGKPDELILRIVH